MSTRSNIGISTIKEGINYVNYVYCHFDGYTINGVGQMLFEHYKDEEKVKKLISLGDISFLEKNIEPSSSNHSFNTPEKDVTVFYHRDRGDMECGPYKIYDFKYYPDNMIEYSYLFENGEWYSIGYDEKQKTPTKTLIKDILKFRGIL
jgi:hypothetical protein